MMLKRKKFKFLISLKKYIYYNDLSFVSLYATITEQKIAYYRIP